MNLNINEGDWLTEARYFIAMEYVSSVEHFEHCICSEPLFSSRLDNFK